MPNKVQTITNVSSENQLTVEDKKFYERTLLERLLPELHLYKDAKKKRLPKNQGTTINFRKFNSLPSNTVPLEEGKTPDGQNLDVTAIEAVVKQYGDYVTISDLIQMTGIDPIVTETSELCGEQGAETVEKVIYSVLTSGVNVFYAGGKTQRDALADEDIFNGDEVKKAVRVLKNKNARRFSDGYFHAYIDPDIAYDLMSSKEWEDVAKYAKPENMLKGEIGKMHGVRFMESTMLETEESTTTVHKALIYGKDAYGAVDLENGGGKPSIIVKPNGSAGTADPLDQRASVGWKSAFTSVILQPDALLRVECAVSK